MNDLIGFVVWSWIFNLAVVLKQQWERRNGNGEWEWERR